MARVTPKNAIDAIEREHQVLVSHLSSWLQEPSRERRAKVDEAIAKHGDVLFGVLDRQRYDI